MEIKIYKKKVFLSTIFGLLAMSSLDCAATAATKAVQLKSVKIGKETEENKKKVKKIVLDASKSKEAKEDLYPQSFFFDSPKNGDVFSIYRESLDSKILHTKSAEKKMKLLGDLLDKLIKAELIISKDLNSIHTAEGTTSLSSKNDFQTKASFSINIDLGQHVFGIPVYMLGLKAQELEELKAQNELYYKISLALFKYLINKEKLKIAKDGLANFKEHLTGAEARFKTGVINQIGLRQAEQNYAQMQSKYAVALVQVQSSTEELSKYSDKLDLTQLEKCEFNFEKIDLDAYMEKVVETLPVREAKAQLQLTRAQSAANAVSAVTPTLRFSSNDLFLTSNENNGKGKINIKTFKENGDPIQTQGKDALTQIKDPNNTPSGSIQVSLAWDVSPSNVITFARAVHSNKLAVLNLVKAKRDNTTGLQNLLTEFKLQKETVKMYRNSADLKRSIADLSREKDIRDAERYYGDLLKADLDVAKAYEELQSQILILIEGGLKIMEAAGILVPYNHNKVEKVINEHNKTNFKSIEAESEKILSSRNTPFGQETSEAHKPVAKKVAVPAPAKAKQAAAPAKKVIKQRRLSKVKS